VSVPSPALVEQVLALVAAGPARLSGGRLLCVDGPAGSGKTTLGAAVQDTTGATVVHLDELLDGWTGGLPKVVDAVVDTDGEVDDARLFTTLEVTGDGVCKPHPSNCETIHLRKGETEFFDIKDESGNVVAQYQLDLVDIRVFDRVSVRDVPLMAIHVRLLLHFRAPEVVTIDSAPLARIPPESESGISYTR
jgi:hypothetical protein